MPLIVGNLLADPAAQSFISLEDAVAYLAPENRTEWELAPNINREASLVMASRWLAATMQWRADLRTAAAPLADLAQMGRVAARLAVEALSVNLWEATQTGKTARRMKADTVEIEYADDSGKAQAAGRLWPWLMPMLDGLTRERALGIGAMVV